MSTSRDMRTPRKHDEIKIEGIDVGVVVCVEWWWGSRREGVEAREEKGRNDRCLGGRLEKWKTGHGTQPLHDALTLLWNLVYSSSGHRTRDTAEDSSFHCTSTWPPHHL
jgi:hypothetical protein